MRKKYYLIFVLLLSFFFSAQAQWTATNGPFGGNIARLKKAPNGNLYAVINQKLFRSTNNGDLWAEVIPTSPTSLFLNDIMIDADGKLYAAYWSQLFSSSDNGVTWTTVATNIFQNVQYIERIGPDNVFVIWGNSGVYVSINKGVAWTQLSTLNWAGTPGLWANTAGDIFYGVQGGGLLKHSYKALTSNWSSANMTQIFTVAPSSVNSLAIDGAGNIILSAFDKVYRSVNGGTSFTNITTTSGLAPTYTFFSGPLGTSTDGSISFFNNGASPRVIHKLTSGGTTWTTTPSPTVTFGGNSTTAVFVSASTYLLGTSEGVLRTTDTGTNWLSKNIGLTGTTTNQIVVANTTGKIIVGKYGNGYTSSVDGGATWTQTALPGSGYMSKVLKLANGNLLLYGAGQIWRSVDNGVTFSWDNVSRYYDNTIAEAANGDLYLFYQAFVNPNYVPKIAKSIDSGATWVDLAVTGLPATNFSVSAAAIDGTTNMIFQGYDGTAYKTFKLVGTAASQLTMPYTSLLNNIFFQNNKFYASQFSAFYTTSDLGTTWSTVSFSGNYVFPIKNATYTGIAVSRAGSLYTSQDGGGTWSNTILPSTTAYITNIASDAAGDYYASASGTSVLKFTNELLVDPTTLPPFISFNWQPLNGPYGGNVSKVEIHPNGTTMYSISQNRLWKNTSGTWSKIEPVGTVPVNSIILDVEVDPSGNVYALPQILPQKIFKSTDGGTNWTALTSTGLPNASNSIRRIEILSNGSILAFGVDASFGRIYKSVDGGATFTLQYTSAYNVTYGSDQSGSSSRKPAISPTTGVIAIMGHIAEGLLVSTDNGTTWTAKSTASVTSTTVGFVGSYMYDKNGNLILQSIVDTTIPLWDARISKSTDNGTTWTKLNTPTITNAAGTNNYSKRVVVLGTGEYLMCVQSIFDCYRSTDGGTTWNPIGNVGDVFLWATSVGTTSYITGSGNAGIMKTTDGGQTFTPYSNGIPHPNANDIRLSNNKDLIIGATRPYYSSDFGQTLSLATLQPATNYLPVADSLIGYGSRLLLKSKDGGKTWANFGTDRFLTFLTADATGNGYYGSDGFSLNYSTNLITWTPIALSGLPTNYVITDLVIDPGGIIYSIIVDQDTDLSDVYKIVFGSATKISTLIGTTQPATIKYANSKIYLYDARGIIYRSTDGETWTQGSAPAGFNLVITNNNYLFIPAGNNTLWLSRNDGGSWQSVGDVPVTSGTAPTFVNLAINEYDGIAYATLTNSVAKKSGNMIIPDDKTKPVATVFSPVNNAANVGLKPVLKITFDEITKTIGGKLVRIFDLANQALPVQSIDIATATQSGKTWSIPTTTALAFNKTYFVVVDAGAFTDIFGNASLGISSTSTWRFTTKLSPTISSLVPASNSTAIAINTTLKITFSEAISGVAAKNVGVYKSSSPSTPVATVAATAGVASGNNLTFTLVSPLEYSTAYFVKADAGAFQTVENQAVTFLSQNTDWVFTTVTAPDTQAPTISFTPDAQVKGASKTFSATITDNVGVAQGKIFYRSITSNATESSANLILNGSTGKYDVSVTDAEFGKMGLEYYFTASDAAGNSIRSPLTGYYYSYISLTNSNPQIPGGLVGVGGALGDWRMIGIPYTLTDSKIATVFSELGGIDLTKWRLITYKNQTSWNQYPGDFTTFNQGKGYFINVKTMPASGLVVEGATTPSNNKTNPYALTLTPGWNQIGNPYSFKIVWSEVMAANPGVTGVGGLKKFTGSYVDGTDLDVFEGAFVNNTNAGSVNLTIPITGSLSGGRVAARESYDLSGQQWVAPIRVTIGDVTNTFGGVGMHPDASLSIDQFDDFNPPAIADYANMNFAHPEHFLKVSTRDVVPTQDSHNWTFILDSNVEGPAELNWDNTRFGNNNNELFLFDVTNQTAIDMRSENSYQFNPAVSREFRVYFGENLKDKITPDFVSLGQPYPNPAATKTSIPFRLPGQDANYSVKLEVYDMLGKKVATLVEGNYKSGFYSTVWNTEDTDLVNGMYTVRFIVGGKSNAVLNKKVILKK